MSNGGVLMLSFIMFIIGMGAGDYISKRTQVKVPEGMLAFGYNEENNVWNRIRVDEFGKVICRKD
jgi:hypothetical protein